MSNKHEKALRLERIVRRLFKCDRSGVSGLADADVFERNPIYAAIMVVSYIHAKGLQATELQYDEFLHDYEYVFTHPEEYDIEQEFENYIDKLSNIVEKFV